jgi:hypothetical protein
VCYYCMLLVAFWNLDVSGWKREGTKKQSWMHTLGVAQGKEAPKDRDNMHANAAEERNPRPSLLVGNSIPDRRDDLAHRLQWDSHDAVTTWW